MDFWHMELNFISYGFFHALLFDKHGAFAVLLYPCVCLVTAYVGFFKVSSKLGDKIC